MLSIMLLSVAACLLVAIEIVRIHRTIKTLHVKEKFSLYSKSDRVLIYVNKFTSEAEAQRNATLINNPVILRCKTNLSLTNWWRKPRTASARCS